MQAGAGVWRECPSRVTWRSTNMKDLSTSSRSPLWALPRLGFLACINGWVIVLILPIPSSPVTYVLGSWVSITWVLYRDQGTVTYYIGNWDVRVYSKTLQPCFRCLCNEDSGREWTCLSFRVCLQCAGGVGIQRGLP